MTRIQNHMTKIVRILVFAFLMLIPVCGVAQDKIKIACIGNSITEGLTIIRLLWLVCSEINMKLAILESGAILYCEKGIILI